MKNVNRNNLSEMIALGEGTTLEFKRSGASGLGQEICAFANSSGGRILLGITDDGDIVGVSDINRLKSDIQNIAHTADPPIRVDIELLESSVLCVKIPPQREKPYAFGGRFYFREGANSRKMSRDETLGFFHQQGLIHYDETICHKFSLDADLDETNWNLFRTRANIPADMPPEIALKNLHLADQNSKVTNAGAWLLAKDIRKFHSSATISCALFMGTDKVKILDRRDFHGDVYSTIDETMSWILSKINVEFIIEKLKREERPELPEKAIREAVVNALAHRDYRSTANVQIYLYSDRLEIVSPGGLPAGMTEADLGVKSVPRNPLLFDLLYRMNAVEHIGSGIIRIRNLCSEHGVAQPIIEVSENWFTTIFPRPKIPDGERKDPERELTPNQDKAGTKSGLSQSETGTKSGLSQSEAGTKSGLSQDQVELIRKCDGEKTASELIKIFGRSNRSKFQKKVLKPLIKAGLLEMTIPDKPQSRNQKYRLTTEGQIFLESLQ